MRLAASPCLRRATAKNDISLTRKTSMKPDRCQALPARIYTPQRFETAANNMRKLTYPRGSGKEAGENGLMQCPAKSLAGKRAMDLEGQSDFGPFGLQVFLVSDFQKGYLGNDVV
jgi:hypothetical protein